MESNNIQRRKILIFSDWFEPGYKAGGPIRSAYNFAVNMQSEYDIYVFTSSHDLNDKEPYPGIVSDTWLKHDQGFSVFYSSPKNLSWSFIFQQVNNIAPDFLYLNSMFSKCFAIYPLLMKKTGKISGKIILAPRGMLKESALQVKPVKKKVFLRLFKTLNLHKVTEFHATDVTEKKDILKQFGQEVAIAVLPNFALAVHDYNKSVIKRKGELQIVFISRIHPIKNLDFLLSLLTKVEGNINLTICGSREDEKYVKICEGIIHRLPANISAKLIGEVPYNSLPGILNEHHILALPTKGENFGHIIFEALAAGKPVLISDQTPWTELANHKAGWDISLNDKQKFISVINTLVKMEQAEYDEWSFSAWNYSKKYTTDSDLKKGYLNLFQ